MEPKLYWQIHRLAFSLEKRADEVLRNQLDIGFAQYKVLEAINQNPLTKQNIVASLLDQTEASISRQVKILQKKGLISIQVVMGNKRAKELHLTRVGEDIVRQAEQAIDIELDDVFEKLSYSEQRVFYELSERLLLKPHKS